MRVERFSLDESVLPRSVYRDPFKGYEIAHKTTSWGLVLEDEVQDETGAFLEEFLAFHGYASRGLCFRLDAFLRRDKLLILEVNVETQDGWGVALNLVRAAGVKVEIPPDADMPGEFIDYGDGHRAEFELACQELALLGCKAAIKEGELNPDPWFWGIPWSIPKHELDDKMYLARFASTWQGESVLVPKMYHRDEVPWEEIPEDVIFKFGKKYGPESRRASCSVIRRKSSQFGKGERIRACYERGRAIAQEWIEPLRLEDGSATQAVILCAGVHPITGYLQVMPAQREFYLKETLLINDKSALAGPLVFVD